MFFLLRGNYMIDKINTFALNATPDEVGFTEKLVQGLTGFFSFFPDTLVVFIISLFPILECRGALIAASPWLLDVNMWIAVPISIIGNLLPIPFIFLFIEKIFEWIKKRDNKLSRLIIKIENKALSKSDKITKYKRFGLLLFVGIPLPGTGAWTGALIAVLLKLKLKDSVICILLGVIMATAIMTLISYGIPALF